MAIQMRRGNVADLDESKLVAGEFVVGTDEEFVAVAKGASDLVRLATKNDLDNLVAVSGIVTVSSGVLTFSPQN